MSHSGLQAGFLQDAVIIRIYGDAALEESISLKEFYHRLELKRYPNIIVDFKHCQFVASTFIGVLVRIDLERKKAGSAPLCLENIPEEIRQTFERLNLVDFFQIRAQCSREKPCLSPIPKNKQDELNKARIILNAHEALVEAHEANEIVFRNVREILKKEIMELERKEAEKS